MAEMRLKCVSKHRWKTLIFLIPYEYQHKSSDGSKNQSCVFELDSFICNDIFEVDFDFNF